MQVYPFLFHRLVIFVQIQMNMQFHFPLAGKKLSKMFFCNNVTNSHLINSHVR